MPTLSSSETEIVLGTFGVEEPSEERSLVSELSKTYCDEIPITGKLSANPSGTLEESNNKIAINENRIFN